MKTMRIDHYKAFFLALIVGLVGGFISSAAKAQLQPAHLKIAGQATRIAYQQSLTMQEAGCAASAAKCTLTFGEIPAGKRFVLENISLRAEMPEESPQAMPVWFGEADSIAESDFKPEMQVVKAHGAAQAITLDRPMRVYYEPGAAPMVGMDGVNRIHGPTVVTVRGYLVDATY